MTCRPCVSKPRVTRRRAIGAAALLLAAWPAAGARAADMPDDTFLRGTVEPAGYTRWDGIVFGAQIGVSNMNADFGNSTSGLIAYTLRNSTLENEASPSSWTTLPGTSTSSQSYGAFLGYNIQWGELVVGVDAAYNKPSSLEASASDGIRRIVTTSDTVSHDVTIVASSSLKLIDYATLRARAGYAFGQFLPYVVLGAAAGRFNYSNTATVFDSQTLNGVVTTFGPVTNSESKDNAVVGGFVAGLGLDVALLPNVFLRGEWEFVAFAPVGGIRANVNTARVGVGLRF